MSRILLKLSGEALAGDKHHGFDEATVIEVAKQVKQIVDNGTQVGIVIGGGNFWRGRTSETIDRTKADQIGMLATVMNCIYVSEIFRYVGMKTAVLTPFECGNMTKLFSKDRANKYFAHDMVVFFAGGTGHPYFSTDTATVLRAIEIEADGIYLAKAIDGVYDSDPYILMNFKGTLKDIFTLVHEGGHSMHSRYTRKTQPYIYGEHSIFTAEVASTVNETLLIHYLLKNTDSPEMRKYLINFYIDEFKSTLFRQTMFAEFEWKAHQMAEAGEPLTAELLDSTYEKLNQEYFGPDMDSDEFIQYEWSRIPHFFRSF